MFFMFFYLQINVFNIYDYNHSKSVLLVSQLAYHSVLKMSNITQQRISLNPFAATNRPKFPLR